MPTADPVIEAAAVAIEREHGIEIDAARQIAASAVATVAEHYAIVSRNLTLDMLVAGNLARRAGGRVTVNGIWAAMFDARPRPALPAVEPAAEPQPAMACAHEAADARLYYWPTESWSVPAANLCGAPDRRGGQSLLCIRGRHHTGRHRYARITAFRDRSHREFRE